MPLLTCPGRHYWAPHIGTPYLVFVDESFRGFFEFEERGYFVHAAVGIPESQYDAMKSAVAPVFEEYRRLTSAGQREIKHTEFKRLAYRDRRCLAMKIRDAFKAHGAFINVFYSPLRSFVLEHVRTRLFGDGKREIPADFKALYGEAAEHLKTETEGPGQSGLIKKLLLLPIGAVAALLHESARARTGAAGRAARRAGDGVMSSSVGTCQTWSMKRDAPSYHGCHRQAEQLQGGAPSGHAVCRPSHGPIREQSRRSLPPAHTATRATNATVQISRSGATILVRARTRPQPFPRWPSPSSPWRKSLLLTS